MTTPEPPRAMTFPNSSNTSAVPYRSTLRIVSGGACEGETPAAWMTPKTCPSLVAASTSAWTEGARGNVHRCRTDVEACIEKNLRRFPLDVGEQDMLACTDPPYDGLADRTSSDNYDYVCHPNPHFSSCCRCFITNAFMALMSRTWYRTEVTTDSSLSAGV